MSSGRTLNLIGLTLSGGNGTGAFANDSGGAIYNSGTLSLDRCTLVGNSSTALGGAIYNNAMLSIRRCTFSQNSSAFGGALINYNQATVRHSTLSSNNASSNGGGIDNGNGAGIVLTLDNSIVAGNTAGGTGSDINNFNGNVTRVGASIVQGYAGVPATGSGTITNADPLLAPLDDYGGPTQTRALILGSPARNASANSAATADQRGFPIIGIPDIGSYEAGTWANYNAYIWEVLPASATLAQHDATFDFDGDGAINGDEFITFTSAAEPADRFRILALDLNGSILDLTYTTKLGRNYSFEYTDNLLGSWTLLPGTIPGTGNPVTTPIDDVTGLNFFIRVRVGP